MRTILTLILLAALAQAPAPPPSSPQPPVTFKVEVNYVEIDANVTDAQGNFVRTLSKDDFQVIEDGKPQTLTVFSMVDIPIDRADPPLFARDPIPADVATNRTPFEGRVFVLVIDDLHTRFNRTARARAGARQFVERFVGANDIVAVVNTSGFGKGMQDFTNNRQFALKAIDAAIGGKAESSTEAALQDYYMNAGTPGGANANAAFNDMQRYNNARNTLRTLRNISDYMSGMRGRRKAVVFMSEGINYDVVDVVSNRYASDVQREIRDLVAAATRANVNIYSVDPRGVTSGMEDAIEIAGFTSDPKLSATNLMNEMRLEHDSLRVVAEETGGFAVLNQNDFRTGFARMLEDNSSYYVLGYYPTNDKRDGRFRNVQVKVLKPDLRVRARRGYVAPVPTKKADTEKETPARTSPALRDALDSPIPISGLTISAFAAPFKGAGKNDAIAMAIEVEGAAMTFTRTPAGTFANDLEVTLFAADVNGKVKDGKRDVLNLALRPQTHEIVREDAFRIIRRLEVPPGKYQLRVGARESGGGRVGTVILDLEAPDFSKGALSMSGIAISSAHGSRLPTASPDPSVNEFKDVLPAPPSASRVFPRNDVLAVFAEVYDNVVKTPHRVEINATVLADDGTVVQTKTDERKSEELQGASGGYGYTTKIPLSSLAPGRYVLRISAKSLLGNSETVAREVEFRVR